MTKASSNLLIFGILLIIGVMIPGCGGGGGSSSTYTGPQTGGFSGLVYSEWAYSSLGRGAGRGAKSRLAGAVVSCGGKSVTTDATGYYYIDGLSVGQHSVTVSYPRHTTASFVTVISANTTSNGGTWVFAPTDAESGGIRVESVPSGATIFINNENTEVRTPFIFYRALTGRYMIHVTLAGYNIPASQTITATSGSTATATFILTPQ